MRIAFYAPLKSPDDPVPSGDRAMARLLIRALRLAGHEVEIASTLRTCSRIPDSAALEALETEAKAEALKLWENCSSRPHLWFTYHPYYKAPDLLGPAVAGRLGIPYVTAEASHAGKRDRDAWAPWQARLAEGLRAAAAHFCFTPADRQGLEILLGGVGSLHDLPPFTDTSRFAARPPDRPSNRPLRAITIAMMRPGVKVDSFAFLAAALGRIPDLAWHLDIVGDGPARESVENAFAAIAPDRLTWHGAQPGEAVAALLAGADLFLWPGFGEAYGMVYLEAQACGLPVVALDSGGVASTMRAGETGLLVPAADPEAYAEAVRSLLRDEVMRRELGRAAAAFAREERSLERAAERLGQGLATACRRHAMKTGAPYAFS